jgi:hypothetical protein
MARSNQLASHILDLGIQVIHEWRRINQTLLVPVQVQVQVVS